MVGYGDVSKELYEYIEGTFGEEVRQTMDVCIHFSDESATCYQNFKDLIPYIMAVGYELGRKDLAQ